MMRTEPVSPRESAIRLLSRRGYTAKGLAGKLMEKGYSGEDSLETVEWLAEKGYIDDEAYAKRALDGLISKGFGRNRVIGTLVQKGVDRELARLVWDEREEPDDTGSIDKTLEKLYRGAELCAKERNRLAQALYRRGFDWDDIRPAIERLENGDDL